MNIKTLIFNPFQVNTYIIHDNNDNCIIIDPACYEPFEETALTSYIEGGGLKPVAVLFTHGHIDHILGCSFVCEHYGLKPLAHRDAVPFFEKSREQGDLFGFQVRAPLIPRDFISGGDCLSFGQLSLEVLHTPGHADGSLCFYLPQEKKLIAGDVLFSGSIGRTDLPTGDYDTLVASIKEKLMILPSDTKVYPGHGPATTIGHERDHNPFL